MIPFKYEKLGNFCFGCGLLGHDIKECNDKVQLVQKEGIKLDFGKWLQADNEEFKPGFNLEV